MADLVERIEGTRFLGPEFLVWLWFKAELFENELALTDGRSIELWFEKQLTLRGALDSAERIQFTGVDPSKSAEAKLALRSNKLPQRARISLRTDQGEFSFVFDADTFSFGSVKLPAMLGDDAEEKISKDELQFASTAPKASVPKDADEQFLERMELLRTLDELWRLLYAEFLQVRLHEDWEKVLVPSIVSWSKGKPEFDTRSYGALLKRANKAMP
jgi:hypothetical protein